MLNSQSTAWNGFVLHRNSSENHSTERFGNTRRNGEQADAGAAVPARLMGDLRCSLEIRCRT
jgi:hypothetical protein